MPPKRHPSFHLQLASVPSEGILPPRDSPITALIQLLEYKGMKSRTISSVSNVGYGMIEVAVDIENIPSFLDAAEKANLQVSDEFNPRLPCRYESVEEARSRCHRRLTIQINRLAHLQYNPYFRDLSNFLTAYRDGDSNAPVLPERQLCQMDVIFAPAPAKHSLSGLGKEF